MSDIIQYLEEAKKRELLKRGLYEVKYYDTAEDAELAVGEVIYYDGNYIEFLPLKVTNEEYELILKTNYINESADEFEIIKRTELYPATERSLLPLILDIIGYIMIIVGIVLGIQIQYGVLGFISSFISAILFFSIAKIIRLLEQIRNK